MTEEKQEGQKTIVSFIVGLLIGGLLVWAFSGPEAKAPENDSNKDETEETITDETDKKEMEEKEKEVEVAEQGLPMGDGKIAVEDQAAGNTVELSSATYPISEGWIGVRDYSDERLGGLLGVVRFSEAQGLVPTEVVLQRPTVAGKNYAVVLYNDNGDQGFNLADDSQIDSVFATFKAN